jgi:hypothetical protein
MIAKGKGPWQNNIFIINLGWNFFGRQEDEDKRCQKNGQTWFFILCLQNYSLWT